MMKKSDARSAVKNRKSGRVMWHLFGVAVVLLMLCLVVTVPAVADSPYESLLPMQITGIVLYDSGIDVPAGSLIEAELCGQTFTYTLLYDGLISSAGFGDEPFLVSGCTEGDIITFSLVDTSGEVIYASETYVYSPGDVADVTLTFSSNYLLPMHIYGTVLYENGDKVPAGTVIEAELNGEIFFYHISKDGLIDYEDLSGEKFLIIGDTTGETITFSFSDNEDGKLFYAREMVMYNPGKTSEIVLTFRDTIDYGTVFVYQDNTGLPDGTWWYDYTSVSVDNGIIYPQQYVVPGTYQQGDRTVYICYPAASYYVTNDNSMSSEFTLNATSVNSAVPVHALVITCPSGEQIKVDGSDYVLPVDAKPGVYSVLAVFDSTYFVPWTPLDSLLASNSFTFTVVDENTVIEGYLEIDAPQGISLASGQVLVRANYYNSTGYVQDDIRIKWRIDNKSVIEITSIDDSYIGLTPKNTGNSVLYAELADNTLIRATASIIVEETEITSISAYIYPTTLSLGTTYHTSAYIRDQFGVSVSDSEVEWSVNYGNVSLIPRDYNRCDVIPISVGTDTITVRSMYNPEVFCSFDVEVVSGTMTPDEETTHHIEFSQNGDKYLTLDAKPFYVYVGVFDEQGNYLHEEEVLLNVENESVVSIDYDTNTSTTYQYAKLIPKNKGTTILSAYSKTNALINDSIVIHVADTVVTSVYGPQVSQTIVNGSSGQESFVYVYDQYGNQLPNEKVTVAVTDDSIIKLSSDDGQSKALTLQSGDSITITGVSPGTVTVITSSVSNPSIFETQTVTVEEREIARIYFSEIDRVITMHSDEGIYVNVYDQYGNAVSNPQIVWTVVNESVLTISSSGNNWADITPVSTGTTTIRAALKSDSTLYDEITVTIEETIFSSLYAPLSVVNLTLASSSKHLYVNGYDQYGHHLSIDDSLIVWTSLDENVVTVDEDGYVYPISVGSSVIRASLADSLDIYAETIVTVDEPIISSIYAPSSINLTLGSYSLMGIGIYCYDQYGNYITYKKSLHSCVSSDESVVTVDESGGISPQGVGTAIVTTRLITNPNVYAETVVTVSEPVYSNIYLEPSINMTLASSTEYLYVTGYDQDGRHLPIDDSLIVWISSDENVVMVGDDGKLYPQSIGSAVVRASLVSSPEIYAETNVTVEEIVISSVTKWHGDTELSLYSDTGGSYSLEVYDQFGNSIENEHVKYSISDLNVIYGELDESMTSGTSFLKLYACGLGTATLRIYAENATNVYSETTITVVQPELGDVSGMSEPRTLVFNPDLDLQSSVTLYAIYNTMSLQFSDQYNNPLHCSVRYTVQNSDILGIVSYDLGSLDNTLNTMSDLTTEDRVILVPKAPGKTTVTATSLMFPEVTRSIEVTVLDVSTLIPNDIQLFGTPDITMAFEPGMSDYLGATLGVSTYPLTNQEIIWRVDDGSVLSISEDITTSGEMLKMTALSVGTATITATAVSNTSLTSSITVQVMEKNPLTVEITPGIVTEIGSDIVISGTASGTDTLRYYHLDGTNTPLIGSIQVNADGSYRKVIDVDGFNGIILIQNPMEDGLFNVGLTKDIENYPAGNYNIRLNENGDVSDNSKVVSELSRLSSITEVCSTYGIDDVFVFASYVNSIYFNDGSLNIDSVHYSVERGETLIISGTKGTSKYFPVGVTLAPCSSYSYLPLYDLIYANDIVGSSNKWEIAIETSNLIPDTYVVMANDIDGNKGYSLVSITMPESIEPTPTPDKPAAPTLTEPESMPDDAEIKTNTVAETNAATKAEVGYQVKPTDIAEMKAPTITRGSLSVMLNDAVKVMKKLSDGGEVEVDATIDENGAVIITGSLEGAESVTVNFIGRQFGDGTGDNNVDLSDAISALRITAEIDNPTNTEKFYMDVSADSEIDLDDSILLLRYVAELVDENYVTKA